MLQALDKKTRLKRRFHNRDIVGHAVFLFLGTYGVFKVYNRMISPRWPTFDRHLFFRGRRVHHYEPGLYLAAIGLALFLEDIFDWNLQREYLNEYQLQSQAT